jgi:hypothetical protein
VQVLRPQAVGAAEPNTEGLVEAGAATLEYVGGCIAYTPALRQVAWPSKFRPLVYVKFEGNTNPKELMAHYTTAMVATGANQKANRFPMALKGTTLSWLMHLREESIGSWASYAFASSARSKGVSNALGHSSNCTPSSGRRASGCATLCCGSRRSSTPFQKLKMPLSLMPLSLARS